jgi:hypothetical protein
MLSCRLPNFRLYVASGVSENVMRRVAPVIGVLCLWCCSVRIEAAIFTVGTVGTCTHTDIQAALLAAAFNGPAEDTVRIDKTVAWTNQNLVVAGHNVRIEGGFTSCVNGPVTEPTVISGAGGTLAPVFELTCTGVGCDTRFNVRLQNIEVRGGERSGIRLDGNLFVTLSGVRVTSNTTSNPAAPGNLNDPLNSGGGIHLRSLPKPSGGLTMPRLDLVGSNQIDTNTAPAMGGGIYCENGTVQMTNNVYVSFNIATQHGGGAALRDGCFLGVNINDGVGNSSGFEVNSARQGHGGGIYANGSTPNNATNPRVEITRPGPASNTRGPRFAGNVAGDMSPAPYAHGGAVYAHNAVLRIEEGEFYENAASGLGGVIYSDQETTIGQSLAVRDCGSDGVCVNFAGNGAFAGASNLRYCGVAYMAGLARITRVTMSQNVVSSGAFSPATSSGIVCWEGPNTMIMAATEITNNTGGASVLSLGKAAVSGPTPVVELKGATIAGNALALGGSSPSALASIWNGGSIIASGVDLRVSRSLIDDEGFRWAKLEGASVQSNIEMTVGNNASSLPLHASSGVDTGQWFQDPANNNYELRDYAANPAIDTSACHAVDDVDVRRRAPFDDPLFANTTPPSTALVGYCDRGARERVPPPADALFANGFE